MSDAELRARIARLSGAIEQHRTTANQYSPRGRGYYSPVRARGRGHYAAAPGRNMTLVNNKTSPATAAPAAPLPPSASASYKPSPHRTLINTHAGPSTVPHITPTQTQQRQTPTTTAATTTTTTTPKKVVIDGVTFTVKGRKLVREGVSPLPAAIKRGTHVLVRKK